jgi:hypothetical protein
MFRFAFRDARTKEVRWSSVVPALNRALEELGIAEERGGWARWECHTVAGATVWYYDEVGHCRAGPRP